MPFATERIGPVADELSTFDADVLCLQEVWLVKDDAGQWTPRNIDAIKDAVSDTWPHSYLHLTMAEGDAGSCTEEEVAPLETCVTAACDGVDLDQLSNCVLANCNAEFFATSSSCQSCAASQLGNPLEEIIATCTSGGGDAFAYGGHNGLLLLSKHPFAATEALDIDSALTYRTALHARIDLPDHGAVDVYCTHLAADLSARIEYPGGTYTSFAEENAGQIAKLLQWVDTTQTAGRRIVMGDFNTGVDKGGNTPELPANFVLFGQAGYSSPYDEQAAPQCTFCDGENTLVEGEGGESIDHVFVKYDTAPAATSAERIFDQARSIETTEGAMDLHLSDHFGIRVDVTP